jgi:hypothetical protein
MSLPKILITSSLAAVALLSSCSDSDSGGGSNKSPATSTFTHDVATQWMDQINDGVRVAGQNPPTASRTIAYAAIAFYEAVVPGMKEHRSLAGQLNELDPLPPIAGGKHHWPAVANTATAAVLRSMLASSAAAVADVDALELQIQGGFTVSQAVLDRSITRGTDLATAILAWAATDGFADQAACSTAYVVPTGPGLWEPTPPALAAPLLPCWGQMRTFALAYGAECSALAPTPFSATPGSKFHLECVEVQTTVDNAVPAEIEIAQFWADNPGQTGTPPGHWVSILSQVAVQHDLPLDVAAEALARVGIAVADAFISCWDMKYYYNYMRPITYIQSATGLNDPTWLTCVGIGGVGNINTPNFPEYTSGHSVQSGAAAEVLTDLLGALDFTDDTHATLGLPARSFTSFREAADEAAISRLYAGIHFRPAIQRGVEQGRCIGNIINTQIQFREE